MQERYKEWGCTTARSVRGGWNPEQMWGGLRDISAKWAFSMVSHSKEVLARTSVWKRHFYKCTLFFEQSLFLWKMYVSTPFEIRWVRNFCQGLCFKMWNQSALCLWRVMIRQTPSSCVMVAHHKGWRWWIHAFLTSEWDVRTFSFHEGEAEKGGLWKVSFEALECRNRKSEGYLFELMLYGLGPDWWSNEVWKM